MKTGWHFELAEEQRRTLKAFLEKLKDFFFAFLLTAFISALNLSVRVSVTQRGACQRERHGQGDAFQILSDVSKSICWFGLLSAAFDFSSGYTQHAYESGTGDPQRDY